MCLQQEQQRREKEEDAREQARLQAEQDRLKQQFAEEKEAEKAKRAAESGVRLFNICTLAFVHVQTTLHSIGKGSGWGPNCLPDCFCKYCAHSGQQQLALFVTVARHSDFAKTKPLIMFLLCQLAVLDKPSDGLSAHVKVQRPSADRQSCTMISS